ncbi:MAG: PAS-domain containing protein [Alphaproteobacteria bacterium]|nr:PAS-domain containing protein [Alphaproteobacteria bacterium]
MLTGICTLSCAVVTEDGSRCAAAIMAVDASGEGLVPAAAVGLGEGEDAILHDAARAYLTMEDRGLEGEEPPTVIDELATPDFGTAWVWPLAGNHRERLGILVRFQADPSGPGEHQRGVLGHAAGLAAMALQHRRTEAGAADWGDMLKTVVENVNQGIALFDKEFRLLHFNSVYQSLYNFPDGFLKPGQPYADVLRHLIDRGEYGDVDADSFLQKLMESLEQGSEWRKLRHRPDGTVIAVYRKNLPGGGAIVTFTDVTADMRLAVESRRNAKLLETIVTNIDHGISVIDGDGGLVLWNQRYQDMFGYPDHLMRKGIPYADLLRFGAKRERLNHRDALEFVNSRLELIEKTEFEGTIRTFANGSTVWVHRAAMPGGGFVASYTDITDLKQVEAELVKARDLAETANRAKTEFLANMSHELRTPLNAIIGFSEIMESGVMGAIEDPRYNEYIHSINESGNHLLSLINDILDLSKIEVGKADMEEENLDLVTTIESCLMFVREQAEDKGLSLVSRLPPRFPPFRGDRRRLKQIFINLLQNAVKFTGPGGTVTVSLGHETGAPVHVMVEDTGIGMSAAEIPRALERFSQVGTGLQRKYEGAGLGLPLARSLAKLHGGDIEIESSEGIGTTVKVILPENRIAAAAKAPRRAASRG